jgi:peroxiredoxin
VHFDVLAKLLADDRRSQHNQDWLCEIQSAAFPRVPTQPHTLLGRPAPGFTLSDCLDRPQVLQHLLQHGPVVLTFYVGSTCHACMHDLLELNTDLDRFHALGAEIAAVSGDPTTRTRQRFEQSGALGFPVLADPDYTVARAYGAVQQEQAAESAVIRHATFLIAQDGRVTWVYRGDAPFRNNQALLAELAHSAREED